MLNQDKRGGWDDPWLLIPNAHKHRRRGSTIRDTTESSGSTDTPDQTQTETDSDSEPEAPDEDAKPKYAKEPIDLDKAIQKKKAGHFLKCADCGQKVVKLGKAKTHREEQAHDNWYVRFEALEGTGIYREIDEKRGYS